MQSFVFVCINPITHSCCLLPQNDPGLCFVSRPIIYRDLQSTGIPTNEFAAIEDSLGTPYHILSPTSLIKTGKDVILSASCKDAFEGMYKYGTKMPL